MKMLQRTHMQSVLRKYWIPGLVAVGLTSALCLLLELTLLADLPQSAWQAGSLALGGGCVALILLLILAERNIRYLRQVSQTLQVAGELLESLGEFNRKILAALHNRSECREELEEAERLARELHRTLLQLSYHNGGVSEQVPLFRQSMRMLNALTLLPQENELLSNCRELPGSMFGPSHHIHKLDEQYERLQQTLNSARLQIALAHTSIEA